MQTQRLSIEDSAMRNNSTDDLADQAVDTPYGDLNRSSSSTSDSDSDSDSNSKSDNSSQNPVEEETTTKTDDDSFSDPSNSSVGMNSHTQYNSIKNMPFSWSDRGQSVLEDSDAEVIDYSPQVELSNGFPYIIGRQNISTGLENTGARVRPELHQALEQAVTDMGQYFESESCHKSDYYEAALTIALWHHDEVLALLSELGYGMRD